MAPLGTPRKATAEQRDRPFGLFAANRHLISVLFIFFLYKYGWQHREKHINWNYTTVLVQMPDYKTKGPLRLQNTYEIVELKCTGIIAVTGTLSWSRAFAFTGAWLGHHHIPIYVTWKNIPGDREQRSKSKHIRVGPILLEEVRQGSRHPFRENTRYGVFQHGGDCVFSCSVASEHGHLPGIIG